MLSAVFDFGSKKHAGECYDLGPPVIWKHVGDKISLEEDSCGCDGDLRQLEVDSATLPDELGNFVEAAVQGVLRKGACGWGQSGRPRRADARQGLTCDMPARSDAILRSSDSFSSHL